MNTPIIYYDVDEKYLSMKQVSGSYTYNTVAMSVFCIYVLTTEHF
jgi:hypothetical protein